MILAAGRGRRLRPVTDRVPKPLLPVAGEPVIDRHLRALARAGCDEVVINLSWLGHQIRRHVGDGRDWGLTVRYSDEGDTPLETAGGIHHALEWLGPDPFLVVNADIVTDYPFERLALGPGDWAQLVLVAAQGGVGDFALAGDRLRCQPSPELTFTGIGLYHRALFDHLDGGEARLAPLLARAAERDRVAATVYSGLWHDVGTLDRWHAAEAALGHADA
jgi:MurNAc alpha-1-phosphate uridylyltransferase